jgi:DNA adenine methylase
MLAQKLLFPDSKNICAKPFKLQLLKWIGNKQRFAHEIASYFPTDFNRYFEPFLGSGAVLATLSPKAGIGSDVFQPLMQIWQALHNNPQELKKWYTERWVATSEGNKIEEYEKIKASYNNSPNGRDLLFLCRSCYGGVVRFRKSDGYMSTPCGVHSPINPESFSNRVDVWHERTKTINFLELHFEEAMNIARKGDLIYCDPPYMHSQGILYKGQGFNFVSLLESIEKCKKRGVFVALSIDGTKKSGNVVCELPIPKGLFEQEIYVNCGRSMLKRFQMEGKSLEKEVVADRLLLTY